MPDGSNPRALFGQLRDAGLEAARNRLRLFWRLFWRDCRYYALTGMDAVRQQRRSLLGR